MKRTLNHQSWNIPLLILVTILTWIISRYFFDVRFDYNHLYIGWQLLDPALLKTRLLESIWYLHSQPPLFNLFTGIVLKLFPSHYSLALEFIFKLLGVAEIIVFYWIVKEITGRPKWAFFIALYFAISPAFILYESFFHYSFPVVFLLTLSVALLINYLRSGKLIWGGLFFFCLALVSLTISMFHLFWIVLIAIILILMRRNMARKTLLAAILPLFLVAGWYFKNQLLFGKFTASTWMGMNLARIMLDKPDQLAVIYADSSEHIVPLGPFKAIPAYERYVPATNKYDNIPALQEKLKSTGEINFNNIEYIYVSDQFRKACLISLKVRPGSYVRRAMVSNFLYFNPATNYLFLQDNRNKIYLYDQVFNFGGIEFARYIRLSNIVLIILYIAVFWFTLKRLRQNRQQKKLSKQTRDWKDIVVRYCLLTIFYLMLVGNLLEKGENMRFRFYIIPFFILLAAYSLPGLLHAKAKKETTPKKPDLAISPI